MKTSIVFSFISIFLLLVQLAVAQEKKKETSSPSNSGTKVQDHNSSRSNKSANTLAPEPEEKTSNDAKPESNSLKKGYDYYQAKSDMNSSKSQTKAEDHNSSRSNKTGNIIAPDSPPNGENSNKKEILPSDKTDKSEAARAKKKSN